MSGNEKASEYRTIWKGWQQVLSDLEKELKKLPTNPGVYLMHSDRGEIIYVDKAISLENRVRQYFQSSKNRTTKIGQMVSHIAWSEYILIDSELEALVLEYSLTKEHRPRYNTMLGDNKSYPYIKATMGEDLSRPLFARDMKKDGGNRYSGPYANTGTVRDTLNLIHKLYRTRIYNRDLPKDTGKERPCLNYHIEQYDTLCQGYISREEYQSDFNQALDFLNDRSDPLIKNLQEKIQAASDNLESERATEYRELLSSVKQVAQKQKVTSSGMEDRDIVAMARDERNTVVQVFFIWEGKLIDRDHFHVSAATAENEGEALDSFVKQFYAGTPSIPRELWFQHPLGDEEVISQWLPAKRRQKARLVVPKKEEKERLVKLAARDAALVLSQDKERIRKEKFRTIGAINRIRELIGIGGTRRMEVYDISNTNGVESVGPMVVYEDGGSKRNDYRKFRIKTVQGLDGYASMGKMLTHKFSHGMRGTEELRGKGTDLSMGSFTRSPDLIMMDGGRGQVNITLEAFDKLGLPILVCGMVKDDNHRARGFYYSNMEIPADRHFGRFRLITRIQDEAHRFAVEYHRGLRGKRQVKSILGDIPGIGPAGRKALMRHFKGIEAVRGASVEGLEQTLQINHRSAESVYRSFHEDKESDRADGQAALQDNGKLDTSADPSGRAKTDFRIMETQ